MDTTTISNDVRIVLGALSDSVRSNGYAGWISFLDSSTEFKWVYRGLGLSYDSIVARFRAATPDLQSYTLSWDSIRVESLAKNEVALSALCNEAAINGSGTKVSQAFDINANLRRINGTWKIHTVNISDYDPWRGQPGCSPADTSQWFSQHVDSLVKATLGHRYHSGAMLDVDDRTANAGYRVYQMMGSIFEDPHRQLEHCFIVAVYACDDNGNTILDSGSVALIRDNTLIWHSRFLIRNMSYSPLPGFGDLNNDGTTDILLSTPADMRGYSENLWIISPDSSGGRLLNQVDEHGESTIMGASDTFEFTQPDPKSAKVIKAGIVGEDLNRHFTYTWNGSVFVKVNATRSASGH